MEGGSETFESMVQATWICGGILCLEVRFVGSIVMENSHVLFHTGCMGVWEEVSRFHWLRCVA